MDFVPPNLEKPWKKNHSSINLISSVRIVWMASSLVWISWEVFQIKLSSGVLWKLLSFGRVGDASIHTLWVTWEAFLMLSWWPRFVRITQRWNWQTWFISSLMCTLNGSGLIPFTSKWANKETNWVWGVCKSWMVWHLNSCPSWLQVKFLGTHLIECVNPVSFPFAENSLEQEISWRNLLQPQVNECYWLRWLLKRRKKIWRKVGSWVKKKVLLHPLYRSRNGRVCLRSTGSSLRITISLRSTYFQLWIHLISNGWVMWRVSWGDWFKCLETWKRSMTWGFIPEHSREKKLRIQLIMLSSIVRVSSLDSEPFWGIWGRKSTWERLSSPSATSWRLAECRRPVTMWGYYIIRGMNYQRILLIITDLDLVNFYLD